MKSPPTSPKQWGEPSSWLYTASIIWTQSKHNHDQVDKERPSQKAYLDIAMILLRWEFMVPALKSPFWHHNEQCRCTQQLQAPTQVAAETEQCQNLHPAPLVSFAASGVQNDTEKAMPQNQMAGFRLPSSRTHEVKSLFYHWCGSNTFASVHLSSTIPKCFANWFLLKWVEPTFLPWTHSSQGCFKS